jgi:hypothetical protein
MTIREVRDERGRRPQAVTAAPWRSWWEGSVGSPGRPAYEGSWRRSPERRRASTGPGPSAGSWCRASAWARCSGGPSSFAPRVAAEGGGGSPVSLLFSAILFSRPLDMLSIFEDGLGGGAIGVPLYGMLGGYALSGRGPRWARIVGGAVAGTAIPIWALTVTSFAGPGLAVDTPRGAWVAVYYWSFLAVLMLACAIPHRAVTPQHAA